MNTDEFINKLRQEGFQLYIKNGQLCCWVPKGALTPELHQQLADNKSEILEILRNESSKSCSQHQLSECKSDCITGFHNGVSWPPDCLESERRYGQAHARLFPLLGHKVITPSGCGILLQVFAQRVALTISGRMIFLLPEQVQPLLQEVAKAA